MPRTHEREQRIGRFVRGSVVAFGCLVFAYAGARAEEWPEPALLRARDLTPFGLLRLDMRPSTMRDDPPGRWTVELQTAYQNTFVASANVRSYLETRDARRMPLRTEDVNAILSQPGDAYYLDLEVGAIDLIVRRALTQTLGLFMELPYLHYGEGRLDSLIEGFHDVLGIGQMGRDLVARDRFQMVYRLAEAQFTLLDRDVTGGFGDPIIGLRYSPPPAGQWKLTIEGAAKIAAAGRRPLLSTGRHDVGIQAALGRRTGRHFLYGSMNAVYYSGGMAESPSAHIIPTLVLAYSIAATPKTSFVLQACAGRSVVRDTQLSELKDNKYLLSIGAQSKIRDWTWNLALTENVANFDNTPDIGVQMALTYSPSP
jgi:hypothetical protein